MNSEKEVAVFADLFNSCEELLKNNIEVTACHNGQTVGEEQNVRVFSIEHIKGLEFEAVFFMGVDSLEFEQPDLFDKYLYVGATRAATYLGLTCRNSVPNKIDRLKAFFVPTWSKKVDYQKEKFSPKQKVLTKHRGTLLNSGNALLVCENCGYSSIPGYFDDKNKAIETISCSKCGTVLYTIGEDM